MLIGGVVVLQLNGVRKRIVHVTGEHNFVASASPSGGQFDALIAEIFAVDGHQAHHLHQVVEVVASQRGDVFVEDRSVFEDCKEMLG